MGAPATPDLLVHRGHALGTTAEIAVSDPRRLIEGACLLHGELDVLDRLASRFREDSEISLLHRHAGRACPVSPELFSILEAALEVARATDGAVDLTVGGAMCRLGYDRDFADLVDETPGGLPEPSPVPGWGCVGLDPSSSAVLLPAGVQLDVGAAAKAWAADRIAERAARTLGCAVLVSLGGDVAVNGNTGEDGFAVALVDRGEAGGVHRPAETVAVTAGGLATSGTTKRRWRRHGRVLHHIVDPATGLPASSPWRTVSVAASSCLGANAAATAAVVKGASALDWLESLDLPARLVTHDGAVRTTTKWPQVGSSPRVGAGR